MAISSPSLGREVRLRELARVAGSVSTEKKAVAARENGAKGGRPRRSRQAHGIVTKTATKTPCSYGIACGQEARQENIAPPDGQAVMVGGQRRRGLGFDAVRWCQSRTVVPA